MKRFFLKKAKLLARFFSDKLNEKVSGYSKTQQKFLLIAFSILFSVICISIIHEAFSTSKPGFTPVRLPKLPSHIGKTNKNFSGTIADSDFAKVERLKASFSLKDSAKYASLLDSIKLFEKLYHAQSKK